jgi:hypothetical protein
MSQNSATASPLKVSAHFRCAAAKVNEEALPRCVGRVERCQRPRLETKERRAMEAAANIQFAKALSELATGAESLQERLSAAWLELMVLTKNDVPACLRDAFGIVETEFLTAAEGAENLTDAAASDSASRILRLAIELWQSPD